MVQNGHQTVVQLGSELVSWANDALFGNGHFSARELDDLEKPSLGELLGRARPDGEHASML